MKMLALIVVAAAFVGVCFVGIGLGVLIGGRKSIKGCSCDFDADRARARARGRDCGDSCGCSGDRAA